MIKIFVYLLFQILYVKILLMYAKTGKLAADTFGAVENLISFTKL